MSQPSRAFVRAAIFPIILAACRGTGPETYPEGCSGSIQLSVRSSAEPTFDWSPRCGISSLTVIAVAATPSAPEEAVWGFLVPEQSPLGPTVAYGKAPSRADVWAGPEVLAVGGRYRVVVQYTVGGDVAIASGEATFIWFPAD
jgi:hypothetical protein